MHYCRICCLGHSLCHMSKKTWSHWQATVVYVVLNELLIDYNSACNTPKTSDSQRPHHEFLLLPRVFNFRRELFYFAVSFSFLPWGFLFCSELFFFAVSFSFLPWAFLFCCELFFFAVTFSFLPWAFLFCHELFFFAVSLTFLPWHLWATITVTV